VEYYGQRAAAGLIVSEATQVAPEGQGYEATPGIHSPEQIAGWRRVTDAVHAKGGRMVLQLWHVGRVSHVSLLPDGQVPVAPSAIAARTKTFLGGALADVSAPRALETGEIPAIVEAFRRGALNARESGFDGVELHGASGYLLDQFLRDRTNRRTDAYGGSIENRARLLTEATAACSDAIGRDRVGVRLSPVSASNDMADSDPQPLFEHAVACLDALGIAYIHIVEGGGADGPPFDFARLRERFRGAYIANNGFTRDLAEDAVRGRRADLVAFARAFLANPDLVERFRRGAALNTPDRATFYGGGAAGYTDYPALDLA
jgi:N-ethylmaleimide reductase